MTHTQHESPKVLLIDMPDSCVTSLRQNNYLVSTGSFGYAQEVIPNGDWVIAPLGSEIPELDEQEIVFARIVQLKGTRYQRLRTADGVNYVWTKCDCGIVDPRPCMMAYMQDKFQKIIQRGGIFVIVVDAIYEIDYVTSKSRNGGPDDDEFPSTRTNWNMLPALKQLDVTNSDGSHIDFVRTELGSLLKKAAKASSYDCTIKPDKLDAKLWHPLATNKAGDVVAAWIGEEDGGGAILLVPQLPSFHMIICDLLETWMANRAPHLFPHIEGSKWLHLPEYEIPKVIELRKEAEQVLSYAQNKAAEIESEICKVQAAGSDWYELLSGTDAKLVTAVIATLKSFGFKNVIDMDKARPEQVSKAEDIQITDINPVLVIDVKGLKGSGTDDDVRQSQKHASIRTYDEQGSTKYKALAILNTQRSIPPDKRNPNPFRDEIIKDAIQTRQGVMTTWDLFNIAKNKKRWNWPDRATQDIFYRNGRIDPVPSHYVHIGEVVKEFKGAFGIVPSREIKKGETLVLRNKHQFEEFVVQSLVVNDAKVEVASAGSNAGVGCTLTNLKAKIGTPVYAIQ